MSLLHFVFVFQEKLIQAIKKIKHEIDECYEAEKDAFVDALEVEVPIDYFCNIYVWLNVY